MTAEEKNILANAMLDCYIKHSKNSYFVIEGRDITKKFVMGYVIPLNEIREYVTVEKTAKGKDGGYSLRYRHCDDASKHFRRVAIASIKVMSTEDWKAYRISDERHIDHYKDGTDHVNDGQPFEHWFIGELWERNNDAFYKHGDMILKWKDLRKSVQIKGFNGTLINLKTFEKLTNK